MTEQMEILQALILSGEGIDRLNSDVMADFRRHMQERGIEDREVTPELADRLLDRRASKQTPYQLRDSLILMGEGLRDLSKEELREMTRTLGSLGIQLTAISETVDVPEPVDPEPSEDTLQAAERLLQSLIKKEVEPLPLDRLLSQEFRYYSNRLEFVAAAKRLGYSGPVAASLWHGALQAALVQQAVRHKRETGRELLPHEMPFAEAGLPEAFQVKLGFQDDGKALVDSVNVYLSLIGYQQACENGSLRSLPRGSEAFTEKSQPIIAELLRQKEGPDDSGPS